MKAKAGAQGPKERVYTDEDRQADSAYGVFSRSSDKGNRSQQLFLLSRLAEAGSAVASYHLGELFYGGATDAERRRGLRSHILAAESGYVRSLVAIQRHEDPLVRKFDLLRDPTPMGCPTSIVSVIRNYRYPRIALLIEGLEQGVLGYGLDIAEELLDEVNFAPASRVEQQQSHLLALAYGLVRRAYDRGRAFDGPGSAAAIAENRAITAGFASLGDWKARERIAQSETLTFFTEATAAQLRAFHDPRSSPIPHASGLDHSEPVDYSADDLTELVYELGRSHELYRGCGINLLTGLLWYFSCVELGCGWNKGGTLGAELTRGYRELGGKEGLLSYLTRIFPDSAKMRYLGEITSGKPSRHSTALGESIASNNSRDVLILERHTSRFQKREESWGSSQIYIPNTTNIHSEHERTLVTEGHFVIAVAAGKACLSLHADKQFRTEKVKRKDVRAEEQIRRWRNYSSADLDRCTTTKEHTEAVTGFRRHEFIKLDALGTGSPMNAEASPPGRAANRMKYDIPSPDVDWMVERARLHQLSQSVRGQAARLASAAWLPTLGVKKSLDPSLHLLANTAFNWTYFAKGMRDKQQAEDQEWRELRARQAHLRRISMAPSCSPSSSKE
jgi:hypothetical protein